MVDQRGPTDCWPWRGYLNPKGYGGFRVSADRTNATAHAYAVELATGVRCPPGLQACHRCDNPPCCNPAHLYYGTPKQNTADSWARGRQPVGSQRPFARITEDQVREIRESYAAGADAAELAATFGLKRVTIYSITSGDKWKHAPGPITRRRKRRAA